ncbi:hypothetical protein [Bacillus multifaciens]|uniref:hypothetical protein n=1 Tax=Bacillus multifaciens TaxID=3068506 RepID=UPI0027416453|nr:hypothetical protein [Bacillus sp. WLY-B-L8]MDP7978548.1 hypothetical protein [Bacillus sp. WLY-B-L8]
MRKYKLNINRHDLWKGCILKSIAHAINVAHYPDFSYESSWDGFNYNIQDGDGARGTVTFHPEYCIGAFQDLSSERSEFVRDAVSYFQGTSDRMIEIAKSETLQYLLVDVDDEMLPLITTAFWIEDQNAYSMDLFEELQEQGGFLLEIQMLDTASAMEALEEEYEMSNEQLQLLKLVYEKRIQSPEGEIKLSKDEVALIGTSDIEGLKESKTSFEEMNITWEF